MQRKCLFLKGKTGFPYNQRKKQSAAKVLLNSRRPDTKTPFHPQKSSVKSVKSKKSFYHQSSRRLPFSEITVDFTDSGNQRRKISKNS